MGQRFIDALIADTLSERYRPSEVDEEHQRLMDAGVRIAHTYAKQSERIAMLDTCEAVEEAMRAWQKVFKKSECKEAEHMPGQGAVDLLMEVYPIELKLKETRTDGNATLYIYDDINEFMRSNSLLGRLGDWFAGLFSVDVVAMPID